MSSEASDRERVDILTKALGTQSDLEELTRSYIERAHCYQRLGDEVNSVRDYLDALDTAVSDSDLVHIKSMIALSLITSGKKEQAIFWAIDAVDQDPKDAEGCYVLGLVCDFCGFLNLAIEFLKRATTLQPDDWDALKALGCSLQKDGQIKEAIEVLSHYVANNPNEPVGLHDYGLAIEQCDTREDRFHAAKELYERALGNNPSHTMRPIIERRLQAVNAKV